MKFNFTIAHIAGSINTAANFSRLELKVKEEIRLKIRKDIQTTPFEITSSTDVADEEQFFFTHRDNESESEEQTLQRKEQIRHIAIEGGADNVSIKSTTSVKEFTKIDGVATSYSMNRIKGQ